MWLRSTCRTSAPSYRPGDGLTASFAGNADSLSCSPWIGTPSRNSDWACVWPRQGGGRAHPNMHCVDRLLHQQPSLLILCMVPVTSQSYLSYVAAVALLRVGGRLRGQVRAQRCGGASINRAASRTKQRVGTTAGNGKGRHSFGGRHATWQSAQPLGHFSLLPGELHLCSCMV